MPRSRHRTAAHNAAGDPKSRNPQLSAATTSPGNRVTGNATTAKVASFLIGTDMAALEAAVARKDAVVAELLQQYARQLVAEPVRQE